MLLCENKLCFQYFFQHLSTSPLLLSTPINVLFLIYCTLCVLVWTLTHCLLFVVCNVSCFYPYSVGSTGKVISFDIREDHFKMAMENCKEWGNCILHRGNENYTKNIEFHHKPLHEAPDMVDEQVDAVSPVNTRS